MTRLHEIGHKFFPTKAAAERLARQKRGQGLTAKVRQNPGVKRGPNKHVTFWGGWVNRPYR